MSKKNKKKEKQRLRLQNTALSVTRWVGSLTSILIHTALFVGSFTAVWFGVLPFDRMLLILTTIVSLEAIYLSIFIQMTINVTTASLEEVEQNIDEIQEDIDEIQEDVDEIQENVEEIQEDVEEIQEDVDEMTEDEKEEERERVENAGTLEGIHRDLQKLLSNIEDLQKRS